MIYRETPVTPVKVNALCSNCGGNLIATGDAFPTCPPLYEHCCDRCGTLEKIRAEKYPKIEYRECTP